MLLAGRDASSAVGVLIGGAVGTAVVSRCSGMVGAVVICGVTGSLALALGRWDGVSWIASTTEGSIADTGIWYGIACSCRIGSISEAATGSIVGVVAASATIGPAPGSPADTADVVHNSLMARTSVSSGVFRITGDETSAVSLRIGLSEDSKASLAIGGDSRWGSVL